MPKIKMLEKLSSYKVTYLADRPGEIGTKLYAKKVFAGNERDAVIAFNNWFDSCKAFPEGSSCDIQKVELIQGESANEAFNGWDGWEEIEGLEDTLEGIENLAYELRSCVRGAKTHCKDWKSLSLYIKGLASNLDDAAELMTYKTDDDEDESKKKNPSKDFSSTVEEDEDNRKKSH